MHEYRGVRLARGELPRATTQTAVELALTMGQRGPEWEAPRLRELAATTLLGQLRSSILDINIHLMDSSEEPGVALALDNYKKWRTARLGPQNADGLPGQMRLDAIACPLDGATALHEGRSGSMSILAVGRPPSADSPWCFVGDHFAANHGRPPDAAGVCPAKKYFVVSLGRNSLTPRMQTAVDTWELQHCPDRAVVGNIGLDRYVRDFGLIGCIAGALEGDGFEPVVGVTFESNHLRYWRPQFGRRVVYRRLDGSSVVSSLAAFSGLVGVGVCVTRLAQAIQIAVAARALGGRIYAFPIEESPPVRLENVGVVRDCLMRRETDFVNDTNALLCATSITELCVLDRVRFTDAHTVSANTQLISIGTHGIEERTQWFNLDHTHFWTADPTVEGGVRSEAASTRLARLRTRLAQHP